MGIWNCNQSNLFFHRSQFFGCRSQITRQSIFEELSERLPDAKFVDAFEMLLDVRAVKSPEEIAKLKRASDITEQRILKVIFPMLKAKATPYEIYKEINAFAVREQGYFSFLHIFADGGHVINTTGPKEPVKYNIDKNKPTPSVL